MAYKLGCMGVTVFRDGCKTEQVLTAGVADSKNDRLKEPIKKPRPDVVNGITYKIATPVGTAFITVNYSGNINQPLEVFVNVGKAGSDIAADAEAIGRLITLCLRISSPNFSTEEVAELVIEQLDGIGGGGSVGFGKEKIRSLADGVAKVIKKHILQDQKDEKVELFGEQTILKPVGVQKDICPSCGNATLALEEGCSKCLSCGFSKC